VFNCYHRPQNISLKITSASFYRLLVLIQVSKNAEKTVSAGTDSMHDRNTSSVEAKLYKSKATQNYCMTVLAQPTFTVF